MKRLLGSILILGLWAGLVIAQDCPDTLWTRLFNGYEHADAYDVEVLPEGGFVVAGSTVSSAIDSNYYDFYLLRLNSSGDTLWTRTYGYQWESWDVAFNVEVCSDGGFILTGFTQGRTADADIFLVKTDSLGNREWQHTYGGEGGEWAWTVKQVQDGEYVLLGLTSSYGAGQGDMYLIKLNALGDTLWTRTYGGAGTEEGLDIVLTNDGGFAFCGYTGSFGGGAYLVRTNETGDTLWTHLYELAYDGGLYSIQVMRDGGFVIAGAEDTSPEIGNTGAVLIRTNTFGDTLWTHTYQVQNMNGWARSIDTTSDGGVIFAGLIGTGLPVYDMWVVRCDSLGDTLWTARYNALGLDEAYSIESVDDDGFIVAGSTGTSAYIVRIGSEHNAAPDEPFILHPSTFSLSVFPNPFNPSTTISFTLPRAGEVKMAVYDVLGREVGGIKGDHVGSPLQAGEHHVMFDGSGLASGVYFVRVEAGERVAMEKMLLLK